MLCTTIFRLEDQQPFLLTQCVTLDRWSTVASQLSDANGNWAILPIIALLVLASRPELLELDLLLGDDRLGGGEVRRRHAGGKVESGLGIGIGDGWMRFMEFDMSGKDPVVHVRTYSTHYDVQSTDHKEYAEWYKDHEQPHMTEAQFRSGDDFKLKLNGFSKRFATKAALVNQ